MIKRFKTLTSACEILHALMNIYELIDVRLSTSIRGGTFSVLGHGYDIQRYLTAVADNSLSTAKTKGCKPKASAAFVPQLEKMFRVLAE